MAALADIVEFTNTFLNIEGFDDYCPNGLQVGGRSEVNKILTGVTASQALLDGAVRRDVDMILVHHGYFWRGEARPITGLKYHKIKTLIENNISLTAYHLPLDAHPVCGNNVKLAEMLGIKVDCFFGPGKLPLILSGSLSEPIPVNVFAGQIARVLGRRVMHLGADKSKLISKVAICTGGAQSYFPMAIEEGVDVFITGEVSEQNYHEAMESGVDFISAGHHATERYGVQALGEVIARQFSVQVDFLEIGNPV